MSIEIRRITKADKEAFIELSLALTRFNQSQHEKNYSNFNEILAVRKKRVQEAFPGILKNPYKLVLMAFKNNNPVGYLRAYMQDWKLKVGCLDELFIKEEAQGGGVGKKLLNAGTQWMKEKKVVRMIASVYLWNAPARSFYEKEGFEEYSVFYEKKITGGI